MQDCKLFILFIVIALSSCSASKRSKRANVLSGKNNSEIVTTTIDSSASSKPMLTMDEPLTIDRKEFTNYAKEFLNIPYLYASSDPAKGFDCSGLLFHVFKYFNVKAPRSSFNYENIGRELPVKKAKEGDLILFSTPTNTSKIGHIGIITETEPMLSFIHASSSKGVIISHLSDYYVKHFVKIIRVLK